MKKLTPLLILLFFFNFFLAQEIEISKVEKEKWTLYKKGKITIFYKVHNCVNASSLTQERVLLKFVNTTNEKSIISFKKNPLYSFLKGTRDTPIYKLTLNPGETLEGKDIFGEKPEFYLFSKFTDIRIDVKSELLNFSLLDIKITTI